MPEFRYVLPRAKRSLAEAFARNKLPMFDRNGSHPCTAAELMAEWKGRSGAVDTIDFPHSEDAADMLPWLVESCEASATPYLCVLDAHYVDREDRKGYRGVLGRVLLNVTGNPCDRRDLNVPYEFGPVGQNLESLVEAGIPEDEASEILERFGLAPDTAPRP